MLTKIKKFTKNWTRSKIKKVSNGRSLRGITMCGKCYTFYYKHSWHFEKPEEIDARADATVPVRFTECSACIEQELSQYNSDSEAFA